MLESAPTGSARRAIFGDDAVTSGGLGGGERDRVEVGR